MSNLHPGRQTASFAREGKVQILGNCQAECLTTALRHASPEKAHLYEYRALASPLTFLSHPGQIPTALRQTFASPEAASLLKGRSLQNQFEIMGSDEPSPRALIFTLFHEATPLFKHKTEGYIFHVLKTVHRRNPELGSWIDASFARLEPDAPGYLARFFDMVDQVHRRFPEVPILMVKRLSHSPLFAPEPFSYLADWGQIKSEWEERIQRRPEIAVLEMDRVVGGVMRQHGLLPNEIFPYFKTRQVNPPPGRWRKYRKYVPYLDTPITRDVEHAMALVWERMAHHIQTWVETGIISYQRHERLPHPSVLVRQYLRSYDLPKKRLQAGDPVAWANAFESMVLHPKRPLWRQLEPYVESLKGNEFLLRNLRACSRSFD